MAATDAGIGEVMTAYFEAERAAGAAGLRQKALEAGQAAEAEQKAFLEIEQGLETAALSRLKDKRVAAPTALEPTRVQT